MVNYPLTSHNRHPIACQWGQAMGGILQGEELLLQDIAQQGHLLLDLLRTQAATEAQYSAIITW